MIQSINGNALYLSTSKKAQQNTTSPINKTNVIPFQKANVNGDKIALALQSRTLIPIAKTISFSGALFDELNNEMKSLFVCNEKKPIGDKTNVSNVINRFSPELKKFDDAIKTTVEINKDTDAGTTTEARTQLKKLYGKDILFEMAVRPPRAINSPQPEGVPELTHKLSIIMEPDKDALEKVSILNTKGKLTAVVEDGHNVLLTSSGKIQKKYNETLTVIGKKPGREFIPFIPKNVPIIEKSIPMPSIGEGGEVVIGMENGRFNAEIIDSIQEFETKLKNGEIVLPQFVAKEGADKIQVAMLAGGLGSRAEYTNATSSGIFHGKENGAQSTKGVFRTPTGLTPMETTFISLHMAGILDCSAEKFGINKNVKFYLNKSGKNKGNGGFTIDLYKKMIKENHNCEFIFPNDSISRMPIAIGEAAEKMNGGKTAIAMIAKKVPAEEARGTFGIMRLSDENEILEFAEKPNPIPKGFADADDNCLTNTFQFAVSKEAFQALELIEPYFSSALQGAETRDWSKHLVPTIMVLTQCDSPDEMRDSLQAIVGEKDNPKYVNFLKGIPDEILMDAKEILHGQKVVAIPTAESWADIGQSTALYDVTMDIAKGDFKLLDFERRNVLKSINPETGLVAMTPKQKAEIEEKYDIQGEVMVAPQAKKVPQSILDDYKYAITENN